MRGRWFGKSERPQRSFIMKRWFTREGFAAGARRVVDGVKRAGRSLKAMAIATVVGGGVLLGSQQAMAQTPTLDPIVFPIDVASIATAIGVAAGVILIAAMSTGLGFTLVKKLYAKLRGNI